MTLHPMTTRAAQGHSLDRDLLLSVTQAGEYLDTGEQFLRRLITERRISYVKVSKQSRLTTTGTQTNAELKSAGLARLALGKIYGQRRPARAHCGARATRRRLPIRRPHGAIQHFRPRPRCRPGGGTATSGLRHLRPTLLTGAVDRCSPRGAGVRTSPWCH